MTSKVMNTNAEECPDSISPKRDSQRIFSEQTNNPMGMSFLGKNGFVNKGKDI